MPSLAWNYQSSCLSLQRSGSTESELQPTYTNQLNRSLFTADAASCRAEPLKVSNPSSYKVRSLYRRLCKNLELEAIFVRCD